MKKAFIVIGSVLLLLALAAAVSPFPYEKIVAERRAALPITTTAGTTGSMKPYVVGGEPIVVEAKPYGELKAGDLVAYVPIWKGDWVIHRIVGGNASSGFVVKGDADILRDPTRMSERSYVGVWRKL